MLKGWTDRRWARVVWWTVRTVPEVEPCACRRDVCCPSRAPSSQCYEADDSAHSWAPYSATCKQTQTTSLSTYHSSPQRAQTNDTIERGESRPLVLPPWGARWSHSSFKLKFHGRSFPSIAYSYVASLWHPCEDVRNKCRRGSSPGYHENTTRKWSLGI